MKIPPPNYCKPLFTLALSAKNQSEADESKTLTLKHLTRWSSVLSGGIRADT